MNAARAVDPLESMLARVADLDLFPAQAARVQAVADDRGASLGDLERVVGTDPALSAALLRLANSAFFGLRRQVGDLRQAILVLGSRATRDLALALALSGLGRSQHPLRARLWDQALRGATAARAIASFTHGAVNAGDAFVAALLRDLGRVLLLELEGDAYGDIERDGAGLLAVERAAYAVDHAELGAACLGRWGIPAATCAAVGAHHAARADSALAAVVWLADSAEAAEADASEDAEVEQSQAARALRLNAGWLDEARQAMAAAPELGI